MSSRSSRCKDEGSKINYDWILSEYKRRPEKTGENPSD